MSSRFYFGGSDSESDNGDDVALPYPEPLARSAFLGPDFQPTSFLSSLANRHQTLEDLRSELRARSQQLHAELLDLVNANYQDFLGLGGSLEGGDERVEAVRVGLLSFRRDIEGLKGQVGERRREVEGLLGEKRQVAERIRQARALLEVDTRLEELERGLAIAEKGEATAGDTVDDIEVSDSEASDDEDEGGAYSVARLRRRAEQFVNVKRLMGKLNLEHPFLESQRGRLQKIRETLLLDINGALAESKRARHEGGPLKVLALYQILEEPHEAVRVLKEQK